MADDLPPPPAGYQVVAPPTGAPAPAAADDLPPPPAGYSIINPPSDQDISRGSKDVAPRPIVDDTAKGAGFFTNMRASLAPDVNDQIKRFAASRFPNDPNAVGRYGVVNGNIVYADEKGNFVRETPSVTGATGAGDLFTRLGRNVAAGTGPAIPGLAGATAGALTAGSGPGSVVAATTAAGTTDVARQAVDQWAAGEPLHLDYLNSAGQAAVAGVGQGLGVGVAKLAQRNPLGVDAYERLTAMDPALQGKTAALEAEANSRGVDLSAGQATGLRSVQAEERQLGRRPETADTIFDFARNQRQNQVPAAVRSEIGQITPTAPGEDAVGQFRAGADTVLKQALDARATQASATYQSALDKPRFWTDDTFTGRSGTQFTLESLMQRPSMQTALGYANKIAAEEERTLTVPTFENGKRVGDEVVPDWRSWDYVKQGLDRTVEDNTNPTTGRLNPYGRSVANTRSDLLSVLDKQNPDYAAARLQYGKASGTVQDMLDGGLGLLNTLKDSQPLDRQAIVRRIFDSGNLTPEEVGRMRVNFATAGKQADWNAGFGSWLSDKLDGALAGAGRTGNTPGQFYSKVWQDPRQQAIVRAALGGDQARVDGMEKLMQVVDASARGLPEGSATATDLPAMMSDKGQMISKTARVAGKLLSPDTYLKAGDEIVAGWSALRAPEKRIALAQTLLSGDAAGKLRQLSLLSPTSKQALDIAGQIISGATTRASGLQTPRDFQPPGAGGSAPPGP